MNHPTSNTVIDLRSDTLTLPTPAMRQAMATAEVGDDVFGEDPTIRRLEQTVAQYLGKEAGLFMPSGTMANQVALRTHTEPGDEVFLEASSHVYFYEVGAPAALSGLMCRCLTGQRGMFTAQQLAEALHPANIHFPRSRLVSVENTSNRGGGSIWPFEQLKAVADLTHEQGLKLHMDGARLWNASVAAGIPEKQYASLCDSVSVCFSKGLGAPVGSMLVGTVEFIERARRFRKMFGGGMRQAGILAAAALHAFQHHRERLAEDHAHAQLLAQCLSQLPGVRLNLKEVETNILIFDTPTHPAGDLVHCLEKAGVRMMAIGPNRIRAVTNLNVTRTDIATACQILQKVWPIKQAA